jgi:hypothetical protein
MGDETEDTEEMRVVGSRLVAEVLVTLVGFPLRDTER